MNIFFKFLFTITFTVVITIWLIWSYLSYENIPNLINGDYAERFVYDYIIVGAGTVGSVLANRLSENPNNSVLLIEAGNNFGPLSIVPLLSPALQQTSVDWSFVSVKQKYSARGLKSQKQLIPRGKGLGGSSQINYMLHFNGVKKDFDKWEELGATGWGYENMKKYLYPEINGADSRSNNVDRESSCFNNLLDEIDENNYLNSPLPTTISADEKEYCMLVPNLRLNKENPENNYQKIRVTKLTHNDTELSMVFLAANREWLKKSKTNQKYIFSLGQSTVWRGVRWNVYHSYLRPSFHRSNLKILLNTRVRKVNFDKHNHATSVFVSPEEDFNKIFRIYAKKEIILSAGAYQTPQLLKLSGVGPKAELTNFKIKVVRDSPLIGENLFDHIHLPLYVSINETISLTKRKLMTFSNVYDYVRLGKGPFTHFGVTGFVNVANASHSVGIFGMGSIDEGKMEDISHYAKETFKGLFPFYNIDTQEGLVLLNTCHQPKSRGTVLLATKDPKYAPKINPKSLKSDEDLKCMKAAISLARDLMNTDSFQRIGAHIHWPRFKFCSRFGPFEDEITDRYIECLLRTVSTTAHHPGGTCAIGLDEKSPLDSRLRIRGVTGLRVADGSVIPAPISGTPNSVLIAVGERAADLILQDNTPI